LHRALEHGGVCASVTTSFGIDQLIYGLHDLVAGFIGSIAKKACGRASNAKRKTTAVRPALHTLCVSGAFRQN